MLTLPTATSVPLFAGVVETTTGAVTVGVGGVGVDSGLSLLPPQLNNTNNERIENSLLGLVMFGYLKRGVTF